MVSEALWADYALIQATTKLTTALSQSDADDVRLDRILVGIAFGVTEEIASVERAVKSHARRERGRRRVRRLTEHAFTPLAVTNPEQDLIWRQAWISLNETFSTQEVRLLSRGEAVIAITPMAGIERTQLSRIKSSKSYQKIYAAIFA